MISLPSYGIRPSVGSHNCDLAVFCDWIEATVLFSEKELSVTDVVNHLIETQVYQSQEHANFWIMDVWRELIRRQNMLTLGSPFSISPTKIERKSWWEDFPAYSYCLFLSLLPVYEGIAKKIKKQVKKGYNEQGELFELLTKESLQNQFPDWSLYHTGWTKNTARKLEAVVDEMVRRLGERKGDLKVWTFPNANEEGLDLLFYRPYPDNQVGTPVFLFQCASGGNWETKLHTPDLRRWTKIIDFAATPQKAFSIPFAIECSNFNKYSNVVNGFFIERYRLLIPSSLGKPWLSKDLSDRIKRWLKPRIAILLKY